MKENSIVSLEDVWIGYSRKGRGSLRDFIGNMFRRNQENILWALKGVSFEVNKGEAFGIIGPNGAGKTTILKLMGGILLPDRGIINVSGKVSAIIELGVGFHSELNAEENIFLNGAILGIPRKTIRKNLESILEFAGLKEYTNMPIKHFSSGMRLRLGFSIVIHTDFDILIVDEVLSVGDEEFKKKSFEKMKSFKRKGKTIIIVSHNLREIEQFCDRTLFLDKGKILAIDKTHTAIEEYLKFLEHNRPQANKKDFLGMRWGNKEAEIKRVRILDGKGNENSVFEYGETFVIEIEFVAHKRIEKPSFGIAIHHQDGCVISAPNTTELGYNIPYVEGKGRIYYRIERLPLFEGVYPLSVAIYDYKNIIPYDHHERLYMFEVRGITSKEKRGGVDIPGKWHIEKGI